MPQGGTGHTCSVKTCKSNRRDFPHMSFFTFPKDPERCHQWIFNTGREDLLQKLKNKSLYLRNYLCPIHFEDSQFMNKDQKNKLVWNAVPTIFDPPLSKRLLPESRAKVPREKSGKKTKSPSVKDVPTVLISKTPVTKSLAQTAKAMNTASKDVSKPVCVKAKTKSVQTDAVSESVPVLAKTSVKMLPLKPLVSNQPSTTSVPQTKIAIDATSRNVLQPLNIQPSALKTGGTSIVFSTAGTTQHVKPAPITFLVPVSGFPLKIPVATQGNGASAKNLTTIQIKEVFSNYHEGNIVSSARVPPNVNKMPIPRLKSVPVQQQKKPSSPKPTCTCTCTPCKSVPTLQEKLKATTRKLNSVRMANGRLKKKVEKSTGAKEIKPNQITFELKRFLNETAYDFVAIQLEASKKSDAATRMRKKFYRWSPELMKIALTLYRDSPRGYEMMKKVFEMPSRKALKRHEREMKELVHLENELLYQKRMVDKNREAVVSTDDDQNENHLAESDIPEDEKEPVEKKPRLPETEKSDSNRIDVCDAIDVQPIAESHLIEEPVLHVDDCLNSRMSPADTKTTKMPTDVQDYEIIYPIIEDKSSTHSGFLILREESSDAQNDIAFSTSHEDEKVELVIVEDSVVLERTSANLHEETPCDNGGSIPSITDLNLTNNGDVT